MIYLKYKMNTDSWFYKGSAESHLSPNISWKISRGLFISNENSLLFTIMLLVVRWQFVPKIFLFNFSKIFTLRASARRPFSRYSRDLRAALSKACSSLRRSIPLCIAGLRPWMPCWSEAEIPLSGQMNASNSWNIRVRIRLKIVSWLPTIHICLMRQSTNFFANRYPPLNTTKYLPKNCNAIAKYCHNTRDMEISVYR